MKYGEYLNSQKVEEWQEFYLDYDRLKQMIKELEELNLQVHEEKRGFGLYYSSNRLLLIFFFCSDIVDDSSSYECCWSASYVRPRDDPRTVL